MNLTGVRAMRFAKLIDLEMDAYTWRRLTPRRKAYIVDGVREGAWTRAQAASIYPGLSEAMVGEWLTAPQDTPNALHTTHASAHRLVSAALFPELDNGIMETLTYKKITLRQNPHQEGMPGVRTRAAFNLESGDMCVKLSRQLGLLLAILIKNSDGAVTKSGILSWLYRGRDTVPNAKIVDVLVCRLRKALREFGTDGLNIEPMWGCGYKLQ